MSDRIKGQGSWRKRDDRRYEYAVPVGKTRTGNTRRVSFYGRTKKEAFAKYERWRKTQLVGDPLEPSRLTLEEFFAQHLEHLEKVQGQNLEFDSRRLCRSVSATHSPVPRDCSPE